MEDKREMLNKFVEEMSGGLSIEEVTREVRKAWILQELRAHRWNQCATARSLGWHRNTLTRNMAQLGLAPRPRYMPNPKAETVKTVIGV